MSTPQERFTDAYLHHLDALHQADPGTDESAAMLKELRVLVECQPPTIEPDPDPTPVIPTTRWEKAKATMAAVWDSETTRAVIKAGGAFAGVAYVASATVKRDHVLERQALQQANQRPA